MALGCLDHQWDSECHHRPRFFLLLHRMVMEV
jgi:hypothetical protein